MTEARSALITTAVTGQRDIDICRKRRRDRPALQRRSARDGVMREILAITVTDYGDSAFN